MKVLHVYRTYFPDPPGGTQEAIRQICLSTQRLGVDNTVFALSTNPLPTVVHRPEARVVRCRSWWAPASCDLGGPDSISAFRKLVDEADVVHYLFPWPYADILREFAPTKPMVLTYISDIIRQKWLARIYAPLMWRTLKSSGTVVFNAPSYVSGSPVLSDGSIAARLRQIPLGLDERSYPNSGDDRVFERLHITRDKPFFLFVGVLRYYKGLHFLLDAASSVAAPIVIAGSGPELAALQAQANQLKLKNVIFAGQISDAEKVSLLQNCYAFVLPSHLRSEAYGMVLVEASIFGKPLISCEIGTGTSFINLHEETGLVVTPESPSALSEAMQALLNDSELSARLGSGSRRRYESTFSSASLGKAYFSVYQDLLGISN